jgi:hypothetical protein
MRVYKYVGPPEIAARSATRDAGAVVTSPADVLAWMESQQLNRPMAGEVTVTYVVDQEGRLRIADRRSEHVACAGGRSVLAAGEMTFNVDRATVKVAGTTNQSAGYCPEPSCWKAVQRALTDAGITHPDGFTQQFEFRRCPSCQSINLVKDANFRCELCRAPLPRNWNLAELNRPNSPRLRGSDEDGRLCGSPQDTNGHSVRLIT